jgi:Uma2 family endonuclease
MGMPAQQTEWTAEMARALPDDGNRYEVLDGELFVTQAPGWAHQAVLARLFVVIHPYVERHGLGWALWSPADIEFSPRRLLQPDLFVVPDTGHGEPQNWKDVTALLLTVEALSPTTARADRLKKRPIYQQQRVSEYWIVDIDARLVERWRPDDHRPEVIADFLEWQPKEEIEPLVVQLDEVFGPARAPGA